MCYAMLNMLRHVIIICEKKCWNKDLFQTLKRTIAKHCLGIVADKLTYN